MTAARTVRPEILDDLAPEDPRARHSRADLRRINGLMGNARVVASLLRPHRPRRILEIGAGDGAFMLRVARRFPSPFRGRGAGGEAKGGSTPRIVLLDRQPLRVPPGFAALGLSAETVAADALDFLADSKIPPFDAVVANLFLHHFEDEGLRELLRLVAGRTDLFVACEPRRSAAALLGTRTLGAIGCNDVTRHDARVSVLAGFRGRELSDLWPSWGWSVEERAAPPFGHAFRAVRTR